MYENKKIEKTDKLLKYVILLIGAIFAGFFALVYYSEFKGSSSHGVSFFLGVILFLPFILLVFLWLCSVITKKSTTRVLLRLTSWGFVILMLRAVPVAFLNLLSIPVSGSLFALIQFYFFSLFSVILAVIFLWVVLKNYASVPIDVPFFKSGRFVLKASMIWASCSVALYGIFLLSIIEINLAQDFLPKILGIVDLLYLLVGLFIVAFSFFGSSKK